MPVPVMWISIFPDRPGDTIRNGTYYANVSQQFFEKASSFSYSHSFVSGSGDLLPVNCITRAHITPETDEATPYVVVAKDYIFVNNEWKVPG